MPEATVDSIRLADAGQRYLASLSASVRQEQTAEVNRFVRWFGGERPLKDLRAFEIENYAEAVVNATDAEARMRAVKGFLAYAKKTGMTPDNKSVHVRLRRTGGTNNTEAVADDKIEVTAEGLAALRNELEALRAQRPKIAEALRNAMADKDFRENAPLDAAREQQAHMEARIRELESMVKRAVIADHTGASGAIRLGSRVRLRDLESDRELLYVLVGPGEVNAAEGRISVSSPVGRALVNHAQGDEIDVVAPSRTFRYRIESVDV